MIVHCPTCNAQVSVAGLPPGSLATCPVCHTVFQLPSAAAGADAAPTALAPLAGTAAPEQLAVSTAPQQPPAEPTSVHSYAELARPVAYAIIFGALIACTVGTAFWVFDRREERRPTDALGEEPADRSRTWRVVQRFSGVESGRTRQFRIFSSRWRVHWAAESLGQSKNNFAVIVADPAGTQLSTAVSIVGGGSDVAYVHTQPGRYCLEILAIDTRWEITIEESD